jgi:Tfp pilus assembly protein PilF
MKKFLPYLAITTLLISFLTGCGPKPIQKQSILDTPDYHLSQGLRLVEDGNLSDAEIAFNRALDLDPDFAEGFSGLALVEAEKGNFKKARELANEGVANARENVFTWAVRGRVKSLQQHGDDWYKKANKDFKRALELDQEEELVYYWWGISKTFEYDYDEASRMFSRVIEMKGAYAADADTEFAKIQRILRAAPGSRVGKRIALLDKIDRADLAVLFMEELKLQEVLEKNRKVEYDTDYNPPESGQVHFMDRDYSGRTLASDIEGHWAETWIKQIIETGVMEVGPENRFSPDQKITKAEFALFIQNILIDILHDESLATKYIGENSRFADMRSGTATYNAAALCIDHGIMSGNLNGTFGPTETVNGADALLIIRSFQNYLKMTF